MAGRINVSMWNVCTYVYYTLPNKKQKNERNQKILSWLNFFFSSDDSSQNIFIKTCDPLIKATASKVVGDDHISHGVKDELDVLGVSCTSHVAINFCGGIKTFLVAAVTI